MRSGNHIAAVGVSDSHNAGRANNPITQAPIGTATTVLRARELSEQGIAKAVRAGHTYVKVFGNKGPDLRFSAVSPDGQKGIMGDTLRTGSATFTARVTGADTGLDLLAPGPYLLQLLRDGLPYQVRAVTGEDETFTFEAPGPGRYQLQLNRAAAPAAFTSPIYLEP